MKIKKESFYEQVSNDFNISIPEIIDLSERVENILADALSNAVMNVVEKSKSEILNDIFKVVSKL